VPRSIPIILLIAAVSFPNLPKTQTVRSHIPRYALLGSLRQSGFLSLTFLVSSKGVPNGG
jgi:hypothetical protein